MASDRDAVRQLIGKSISELSIEDTDFDPKNNLLGAFIALVVAGIGSLFTASAIGVASLPAGLVIALQGLLGGLRTFLFEFVSAFFLPFEIATTCAMTAGADCSNAGLPGTGGGFLVQSAGILGFVTATLVVGSIIYLVSTMVSG